MYRLNVLLAVALTLGLMLAGCDGFGSDNDSETDALEITAVHENDELRFELSDDKIPSGWTTIKLDNETESTHFAFLRKASPEFLDSMRNKHGEVSTEAFLEVSSIPFQGAWNPYFEGEIKFGTFQANLGAAVPSWFFKHRPIGGPGLVSGKETARTTQNLAPGTYFVECYVLGEDGQFHTLSMAGKLEVTEESSGMSEPQPSIRISLDDDGIEGLDPKGAPDIQPGEHTVAVTFEENGTPSGHDLHLIRLEEGTTVPEVNAWMDWPDVGSNGFYNTDEFGPALTSYHDASGPQTFLGGVQDIRPPLPETAYFHVELTPGEYAWVAEIPNPNPRGFLKTFTVSSD